MTILIGPESILLLVAIQVDHLTYRASVKNTVRWDDFWDTNGGGAAPGIYSKTRQVLLLTHTDLLQNALKVYLSTAFVHVCTSSLLGNLIWILTSSVPGSSFPSSPYVSLGGNRDQASSKGVCRTSLILISPLSAAALEASMRRKFSRSHSVRAITTGMILVVTM